MRRKTERIGENDTIIGTNTAAGVCVVVCVCVCMCVCVYILYLYLGNVECVLFMLAGLPDTFRVQNSETIDQLGTLLLFYLTGIFVGIYVHFVKPICLFSNKTLADIKFIMS